MPNDAAGQAWEATDVGLRKLSGVAGELGTLKRGAFAA